MNSTSLITDHSLSHKNDYNLKYIAIILFPVLDLYEIFTNLSLGFMILATLVCVEIVKNPKYTNMNFKLLVVMIILIIMNILVGAMNYSNFTSTLNNSLEILMFTFLAIFLCVPGKVMGEKLYYYGKIFGIIFTFFLYYQFSSYNFLDAIVSGQLPIGTTNNEGFKSIEWGRPNSVFFEPAHYAIYISPIYAVSLIKKEYLISSIFLIGLILSTSSTGIIVSIIVPLILFFNSKKKTFIRNFFIIISGLTILFILSSNFYDNFLDKISLDNLVNNIRFLGPVKYFSTFDISEIFFGIGFNRLSEFAELKGFFAMNYANAFLYSFISFGFLGGIIWLLYIINLFSGLVKEYRILFLIIVFVLLSDQILFNRNLLYLLVWIYAFSALKLRSKQE
ncbi:hypothetical protein NM897_02160 [Planococcus maritimus]|uniref:hypothetical protein n=1 Tax=Planococcus maritimus TaxID=192421 RepID=UPI003139A5A3